MKNNFANRFSLVLILAFLLNGCSVFKKDYPFKQVVMVDLPPIDICPSANHKPMFIPSKSELKEVERILNEVYEKEYETQFGSDSRLKEFDRQYYGYLNDKKERIIFVQCSHKSWSRREQDLLTRTYYIIYDDGCEAVFRVQINLNTKSFFGFNINSCA